MDAVNLLLTFSVYFLLQCARSQLPDSSHGRNGKVVVCYVGTWATYRPGKGAFHIDSIDPSLCSHLVYSFAGLDTTTWKLKSLDPYNDLEENYGKGSFKKMTALKSSHPQLKVTLAVGGWNEGSANYSEMAADPAKRAPFVASALEMVQKYDFDGLDLDWEFPTQRGGRPEDKENFVALIKDLKSALKPNGYILTAAVSAGIETLKKGYKLKEVGDALDYVHLMCYDYHGSWDSMTGSNSPLGPITDELTIESSVAYVLANGIPAKKLVLGLPMYGRTFMLDSTPQPNATRKLGELTVPGAGFQGPFTRTNGFLGFNEICIELKKEGWSTHWDEKSNTPFAVNDDKVMSYDDARSIKLKTIYAMDLDLAGVLVWSLDTDDFQGDCSTPSDVNPKYPLLKTINEAIHQASVTPKKNPKNLKPNGSSETTSCLVLIMLTIGFVNFV
ncbi:hypothetical protein GE061_017843 [Apolygus lucorum]|uniref:GH18 domain-containing protein n=1 Tax=Apolygus lucorum TaxID=248454 RepID=A0A8S9XC65_APOLU|nr:hypothetical protein GE061_017843 [Apolygus lucorum]